MYDKNLDGYNFFVPLSHNVQMVTLKYYLLVSPAFISEFIIWAFFVYLESEAFIINNLSV